MKLLHLVANACLFLGLCTATTVQNPLILAYFTALSLFYLLLNSWLVPGGWAWRNSSEIRGPMGWPVLASLTQMGPLAHRNLAALATSTGTKRLMGMSLGTTRVVISSHPETAREILCSPAFSDRPVKASARALMFERAIGFAPSGEYWRGLRRVATTHMFSPRRVHHGLEGLRKRVFEEIMERGVRREMEERGRVELRGVLRRAALVNMLGTVFGRCGDDVEEELGFMVKHGYEFISEFTFEDYFSFGFLDFWGLKRRCVGLARRVTLVIGKIVNDRKSQATNLASGNDHLSLLLSLPVEDRLKDEDLVAVLWFGGSIRAFKTVDGNEEATMLLCGSFAKPLWPVS
ncbi:hypothetical protein V2J09_013204 [Rumex salicifolius]